jgi:sialate O-acetylesterase
MTFSRTMRIFLATCLLSTSAGLAQAALKLPAIIANSMVVQRGQPVPIWGWADKGQEVIVSLPGQEKKTTADDQGKWKVILDKIEDNNTFEIKISSGKDTITLKNVIVGEVWICSGQSNMEMGIQMAKDGQKEIAAAKYPQLRLFTVEKTNVPQPASDCKGMWEPCTPETVKHGVWGGFSAVAYYFGRELHKELHTPIGLIHTSWGGTPAESWTSRKALEAEPKLKGLGGSGLYNGMIAPLIPFSIRGAIWYQGESNMGRAKQYQTLLPTMIENWRADWGQGNFPFYIVQIAPYRYHNPEACAELWEAQFLTHRKTPNTGLVVTTDIGEYGDIHPHNKQEVGRRLALWALAKTYGKDIVCSGPLFRDMKSDGDSIHIDFDYAEGLRSSNGKPLDFFTIAGADQKFVPAEAKIEGDAVVVSAKGVKKPVGVRFAWREDAMPNLVNGAGLPASPFRTDVVK